MSKRIRYGLMTIITVLALLFSPSGVGFSTVVLAMCSGAGGGGGGGGGWGYTGQVGGVSLDKAATFLADMSSVTGAYFDQSTNRIVFVGKKLAANQTPVFNKDDLAVAIRSLVFNNTIPAVSIGDPNNISAATQPVVYSGGIEKTNFGDVLEHADYDLKRYNMGTNPDGSPVTSSVPGYISSTQRYYAKNPQPNEPTTTSRIWINPQYVNAKVDTATASFVFDQVKMQVTYQQLPGGSALRQQAGQEFAQQMTDNFDAYATENSWWAKSKELAKIVGVVKWIQDAGVASDYTWAKNYKPNYVSTADTVQYWDTPQTNINGTMMYAHGGLDFSTPNSYSAANGISSALKTLSQSAAPSLLADNWNFTQSGQTYDSVAVSASLFRQTGAYDTTTTDMSIDTLGTNNIEFKRHYNSLASTSGEIGNGWDYMPARLTSINKNVAILCLPPYGYQGFYQRNIAFRTPDGIYETFTFDCGTGRYLADKSEYNTIITRKLNGDYQAILMSNNVYTFRSDVFVDEFRLLTLTDNADDTITYNYGSSSLLSSITDPQNRSITINRNTQGAVTSISDWTGRSVSYSYDGGGNLTTVTDSKNNTITYTYDSKGGLTSIKNRQGQTILANSYDTNNRVQNSTDASGLVTTYTYDELNRIVTATDNNSRAHKTDYDSNMRIVKQTDPLNNYTEYTYGTSFPIPTIEKDKNGNTTSRTLNAWGQELSVTYPDGSQITKEYDEDWDWISHIHDSRYGNGGKDIDYTYDDNGWLTSVDDGGLVTSYVNNASGDRLTITDSNNHTTTSTYDTFGHVLTSTSPTSDTTTNTYDNIGRLVQTTDPSNKSISYTYDNNNNVLTVTNGNGTTANIYDVDNRLLATTAPDNSTTRYTYNSSGLLATTKDPLLNLTSYGYDSYNNLSSRQDALNNTTQYQYDAMNRKKQSTTPLGKVAKWEYDANGNITKRTDESSRDITYQYDSLNRLTLITYPDSTTVTNTYDLRGNLTHVVGSTGSNSFTYDNHDRLISETNPNNQTIYYTYDNAGNLLTTTYPDGKIVANTYDNSNQLTTTTDWNNQQITYQYNANGTLLSKTLPNGISAVYSYDSANQISDIQYTKNSQLMTQYSYTRDSNGRILNEVESQDVVAPGQSFNVYTDTLANGWTTGGSFHTTANLSDSSAYQGSSAISVSFTDYGYLNIKNSTGISTSGYTTVSFAAKATQIGQKVYLRLKGTPAGGSSYKMIDISQYGGSLSPTGYKQYNIPLTALGGIDGLIKTFEFSNQSTSDQPKVWFDNLQLTNNRQSNATVYDDTTTSDIDMYSFGAGTILNPSDTSNPRSGTNAIALTMSGYGGVDIASSTSFISTVGNQSLTFAIKASAPVQDMTVRATSNGSVGVGTRIHLSTIGGNPTVGSYKVYTVPLSSLSINNNKFWGIEFENPSGTALPQIFIDDISLIAIPTGVNQSTSTYSYDANGRVTSAILPNNKSDSYTYDAVGNRLNSTENGISTNQTYNADNQLTARGARSFTYDNQGNQISSGTETLTYDFDNKLKIWSGTSPTATINLTYDATGARIGKSGGGATHQFANSSVGSTPKVLIDNNTTASTQTYYAYGDSLLLSQGGSTQGSRQYFLTDAMGNTRYVTDSTGNTIQAYNYDPFGNETTTSATTNYSYRQYQKDRETDLTYLNARYYDSSTGRFISQDYLWGDMRDSQSQNRYAYAANDPINRSDPTGLWYINVGLSGGYMAIGGTAGVMIGDSGVYPYAGLGLSTPGVGASVTYSPGNASEGDSVNGSASVLGLTGSYDNTGDWEVGATFPPTLGASVMMQHAWTNSQCGH